MTAKSFENTTTKDEYGANLFGCILALTLWSLIATWVMGYIGEARFRMGFSDAHLFYNAGMFFTYLGLWSWAATIGVMIYLFFYEKDE